MKPKLTLFVVPHFHFDVAWTKTYEDYLELAFENIVDVLHLIRKNPEYRFCLDQVALVEPFLKKNGGFRDILREMTQDERIEIVCGMYTMPDLNIPSGEFLIRQFSVGKRFFKEELGVDVKCGWIIDSFGHPNQLPQILKKAGFDYYAFCRGAPKDLDRTEFLWEGLDGTRILTHWMRGTYVAGWMPPPSGRILSEIGAELPLGTRASLHAQSMRWLRVPTETGVKKLLDVSSFLATVASTTNVLILNGGDFMPPQPDLLGIVKEINRKNKETKASISTPSDFFRVLEKHSDKLPIVSGELNPVFQGVYSSRISLKKKNRLAENLLLNAEKSATLSGLLGCPYPEDRLEEFGKKILFNQFHDIICGCGVDEVYLDAMKRYDAAIEGAQEILTDALEYIAGSVCTEGLGKPVLVFNPTSWTRTDVAEAEVQFIDSDVKEIFLVDANGRHILSQIVQEERHVDGDLKTLRFIFVAQEVPAMGYKTYYVRSGKDAKSLQQSTVKAGENFIENELLKVTVEPECGGAINSIYDKQYKHEFVDASKFYANAIISERDFGDLYEFSGDSNWMATRNTLRKEQLPEPCATDMSSNHQARVWTESGSVMAKIIACGNVEDMSYSSIITVYNGVRRIDFKLTLDSRAEHRRVRLCVPVNIDQRKTFHEVPFGVAERGEGEYPAQNWVDYSNHEIGITLINTGVPGNSIVGNLASLTLLRSVDRILESNPAGTLALEKGKHQYNYAIYPHGGDWREGESYRAATEFNNPLIVLNTAVHPGKLPKEFSFISVMPSNFVVTALKRNGKFMILRFYEAAGRDTKATIRLFKPFKRVWLADLLEKRTRQLEQRKDKLTLKVNKFEIVTLAFEFQSQAAAKNEAI